MGFIGLNRHLDEHATRGGFGVMVARGEISRAPRFSRRESSGNPERGRHVAPKSVDRVAVGDFSSRTGWVQTARRGQALVEMTSGERPLPNEGTITHEPADP
jgi:hypothetical protein